MKNKMKIIIPLIIYMVYLGTVNNIVYAQSSETTITLDDIFNKRKFSAKYVWGFRSLKDGLHYCKLQRNKNSAATDILEYEIVSGTPSDTIFKGEWLKPVTEEADPKVIPFGNYAFCDDESKILLSTASETIYRYSTKESNYIWDRKQQKLSPLSEGGKQRYAKFSPDGSMVAFVRDNNIFIKDLDKNTETQVTADGKNNEIINGATDWVYEEEFGFTRAFFWAPDGSKIAFYRFDESRVKEYTMPNYGTLYPENNTFKYPKAGEENAIITIHVFDLKQNKTSTIDIGAEKDQYIPRIKWTQDPSMLAIQRMNRHQNHLELLFADISNNSTKVILTEENKAYIDITNDLTFLKDNQHFIWTSEKSGYNHIYLYSLDGKLANQITQGEWELSSLYGVDEIKGLVFYQAYDKSPLEKYVYSITLDGKKKTQLMKKKGYNSAKFIVDHSKFLGYFSNVTTPTEVALYTSDGDKLRILEDNESLKEVLGKYPLTKKEFFDFKTSEGVQLNGWMVKPHNFDPKQKYPVLMYVYGGPGSQTVTNRFDSRGYMWYQHLAQKGYIIVSVDNRGTGGRGEDFKKMTYLKLGQYETTDQIEAAKYLSSLKYVDPERIGIWGWSYGGYTSVLCITKGADVFKMAIAVAPVSHWKFYDTIYTERFMRTPKENPEGYEAGSPLNFTDKLRGNFLIIHGTADDNVHFQNSAELIGALVKSNKQFDMAIYPDKNHSIYGGVTRWQLYTKMTNYILENL